MRKFHNIFCLLLALFILSTYITPPSTVFAASSTRYSISEVTPEQFTNSEALQAGLQKVMEEYPAAFTKSGEVCSRSHSAGESNCLWFTPHQNYADHAGRSTQCFGYANYVYESIFGQYWGFSQYFSSDGTLGNTTSASSVKSEFDRLGVSFGTIARSYSASHSFIVLKYDDEGVWIIHANYAGSTYGGCNTSVYYYPWSIFAKAYGQLGYIIIPDRICESCTYTVESFPVCTVCSHRFGVYEDMYAAYSLTQDTKPYTIPIEGNEQDEIIASGSEVIVTGTFTINGEEWAKCGDEKYIRLASLEFVRYEQSMELNGEKYPDTYIVKGKSFWLEGKISSKNKITSLTVEILNDEGIAIDKNTIYPNSRTANVATADILKFSRLGTGYYTFRLSAVDSAEEKVFIESRFRVISDTTIADAFEDHIFREYVINNILGGIKESSYIDLYDEVLSAVEEINVSAMGITSLEGISRFTSLRSLDASDNHLTGIDLSGLVMLDSVNVSGQSISAEAVYERSVSSFVIDMDGVIYKEYPRPDEFPKFENAEVSVGFGDTKMDIAITVNADIDQLCDTNGDGAVSSDDLSYILVHYGVSSSSHEDVNYDGVVDIEDISIVLSRYGTKF